MGALRVSRAVRVIVVALPVVLACSIATTSSAAFGPSAPHTVSLPDRSQVPVVSKGTVPASSPTGLTRTPGAADPTHTTGTARASGGPTAATPAAPATSATSATPTVTGASTGTRALARFDLDGDGLDEIVASAYCGVPGDCVTIRYSRSGRTDFLIPPVRSPGEPGFGGVMAAGDFNGDGHTDLAVGSQDEYVPGVGDTGFNGGGVWVYLNGPNGLDASNPQHFNLDTPGIPYDMQEWGEFGSSLAAGDLNGDGYADLAIGADGEKVGDLTYAGVVIVLYGGPAGLSTSGVQALAEGSGGVPGPAHATDEFGSAVAIGDVTGDGYADLAVGAVNAWAPGWTPPWTGVLGNGMVVLLRGSAGGLTATGSSVVYGIQDVPIGALGERLAITDVNGDGHADVLAAITRYGDGGLVYLPGTANGIGPAGARVITNKTPGVPNEPYYKPFGDGVGNAFGSSIATGDVTGDGLPDVLLGAVGTDFNGGNIDAGAVYLIPGSKDGLTGAGTVEYWPGKPIWQPGLARPEPGDGLQAIGVHNYGYSVSLLHLDPARGLDILVSDYLEYYGDMFERLHWTGGLALRTPPGTSSGVTVGGPYLQPDGYTTGDSLGVDNLGNSLLHG